MALPELEEFRRKVALLRNDPAIAATATGDNRLALSTLTLDDVARFLKDETCGYYFMLAATELNRTSLRKAATEDEAQLVPVRQRKAYAVRSRLPVSAEFDTIASSATALRQGDLQRKARGQTEQLFRDRLAAEGVPIFMSPPRREVPGVVIGRRKPDGVWPDPKTGEPPVIYLEVKRIQRVADDIQKRLYELAEASLEMKLLYGNVEFRGLGLADTLTFDQADVAQRLSSNIAGTLPVVVGLFLCPRPQAERYRIGAQALIDRVFFQEEIDDCIAFIKQVIEAHPRLANPGS